MSQEFAAFGYFEITGVIFALISVVLAIKEKRACWTAAIISSVAYMPTFYLARLYTEVLLQLFFVGVSILGWINWTRRENAVNLEISKWNYAQHLKACLISLVITSLLGLFLKTYSNASFPFVDSGISIFSVLTSVMQARKIHENWVYWIIIDATAAVLYIQKGLMLTAGLYGLYLIMAAIGYLEWKKAMQKKITK